MGIQFKTSVLEMLVLSIIEQQMPTSFQIEKTITSTIKIPDGSIYPLLHKLYQKGYVLPSQHIDASGKMRKLYQLTAEGLHYKNTLVGEWNDLTSRINQLMKEE